jgi:iron complex outermembrane receptor protein
LVANGAYLKVAIPSNQDAIFTFKGNIYQLTGSFDLDFAKLTSYTQYRKENSFNGVDNDETAVPLLYVTIPYQHKVFTQELLLTSHPGGRLQWTTGLFYFNDAEVGNLNAGTNLNDVVHAFDSVGRTQSIAAYADATYRLTDQIFLTAGARYSHDIFDRAATILALAPGVSFPLSYPSIRGNSVTPRAVLRYQLDSQSSVYASYTRGTKSALIDLQSKFLNPAATGAIKPEKLDAFEVGYKYAESKFSFSAASWYYNYKNLQVSFYPAGIGELRNAESARVYGAESEARYEVLPGLQVNASAAYVNAKYITFGNGAPFLLCDQITVLCVPAKTGYWVAVEGVSLNGKTMQRAPKFSATLGANYGFDFGGGQMNLSGNLYYTSPFYFDAAQQFRQKGYALLGLRAEWTDSSTRYTVAFYGDNVTNTKYYTQAVAREPAPTATWAAPATWGVSFRSKF